MQYNLPAIEPDEGQATLLAWYPAQRKSAWYTLMRFRLIKSGVLTFMTFTIFRGVFADKIYVPTYVAQLVKIASVDGVPPLRILCGL